MEQLNNSSKIKILRPQFNGRLEKWHIAYKTEAPGGGWARFSASKYLSKGEVETRIDKLVNEFPQLYAKEAQQ